MLCIYIYISKAIRKTKQNAVQSVVGEVKLLTPNIWILESECGGGGWCYRKGIFLRSERNGQGFVQIMWRE